jgi:hypothetical protein
MNEIRDSLAQVQELKPCPMCGGEAHLERQGHVACKTGWPCVHTAYFNWGTPEEQNAAAITAWNTRHGAGDADHSPDAGKMGEDSARLDYIERTFSGMKNRERYLPVTMIWGNGANGRTLREACDKYMAKDAARAGERG